MKLGDAGEAFFVEEVETNDLSDFCTSPITSPEVLQDVKGNDGRSLEVNFCQLKQADHRLCLRDPKCFLSQIFFLVPLSRKSS